MSGSERRKACFLFVENKNKSSLKEFLPLDRQEKYKAFIKKNKIKWGDPADLIKLIEIIR